MPRFQYRVSVQMPDGSATVLCNDPVEAWRAQTRAMAICWAAFLDYKISVFRRDSDGRWTTDMMGVR